MTSWKTLTENLTSLSEAEPRMDQGRKLRTKIARCFIPRFWFKIIYIKNFCSREKERRMAPGKTDIKAKQKNMLSSTVTPKQLTDLKDIILSHHKLYKQFGWIFFCPILL